MWSSLFWKDTFERLVSTVAQVLIALFTADQFDLLNADWKAVASAAGIAAVLVVLKALAANASTNRTVSPASFAHDERGL